MPIITTKVAVIGGFLLLGLLAVAVWLLASASPASAQTDDAGTAHESASTAPPDSTAPPPVDLQLSAPELPPLPTDLNALAPTLPSVTDVLPPPLQPAVSDAAALLPARVRAPLAPVLSHAAPAPVDVAPATSAQAGASPPPPPSAGTPTPPHGWPSSHAHSASAVRAAGSSSHQGDTRAPPSGAPSVAQGSLVSSSAGRDFGQSMLLFGVVAAGIILLLGRGRRLWREVTGWLPAPWCFLIERPG